MGEIAPPAKPDPRLYSPSITVLATIVLFLGAQLTGGIVLGIIPIALGWERSRLSAWLETSWAQFMFVLLVEAVTIAGIWWLLKRRKATFWHIGLNKPQLKHVGYALAGFASYFVMYLVGIIVLSSLIPSLDIQQEQQIGFDKTTTGATNLLPIFVSLVILPPLVEEIVARGFLFTSLRAKLSFITTAVVTSILFAAAHLGAAEEGLLWVAAIDTFILSMVMCYLREKSRSLWPAIGVHVIKNGLAFFILFNIAQYFR